MKPFRRLFHSLYVKLLSIYGVTFILLCISLVFVFKVSRSPDARGLLAKNISTYGDYLVKDIGTPPNLDRARELHSELQLNIYIEGPNVEFSTDPGFKNAHDRFCQVEDHADLKEGEWKRWRRFIEVRYGEYHYVLAHPSMHEPERAIVAFLAGGAIVLLILFGSYRWVRRILRPIDEMKAATQEYGSGNWKARLSPGREDELGALAQTMNQMAERIERHFRSVRELLVAVSHELRSPLTRMRVALESVQDEKVRESLEEDLAVLDRMTENLLEKERIDSSVDSLRTAKANLVEELRSVAKAYPERLELKLPEERIEVEIDSARILLCLRNLIENAMKYSDHSVRLQLSKEDSWAVVSVSDRGKGISKEDLNHVFEPFFQSDPSRTGDRAKGGFGLGLSLCQSIVRAHKGTIAIKSEENQGTTVLLKLPLSD